MRSLDSKTARPLVLLIALTIQLSFFLTCSCNKQLPDLPAKIKLPESWPSFLTLPAESRPARIGEEFFLETKDGYTSVIGAKPGLLMIYIGFESDKDFDVIFADFSTQFRAEMPDVKYDVFEYSFPDSNIHQKSLQSKNLEFPGFTLSKIEKSPTQYRYVIMYVDP